MFSVYMCTLTHVGLHTQLFIHVHTLYIHTCTRRANLTTFILSLFFYSFLRRQNPLCCLLSTLRGPRGCGYGYAHHAPCLSQGGDSQKGQWGAKCDAVLKMYILIMTLFLSQQYWVLFWVSWKRCGGKNTFIKHGSDWKAGLKHKKVHAGYITNYSDSENRKTKTVTLDMETK